MRRAPIQRETPDAEEVRDLRRYLRDLLAIASLSAVWAGSTPTDVAVKLADILVATFRLRFALVRLECKLGRFEHMRYADPTSAALESLVGVTVQLWLDDDEPREDVYLEDEAIVDGVPLSAMMMPCAGAERSLRGERACRGRGRPRRVRL